VIPKLVHRFWLGKNRPDPFFVAQNHAWAELNPGWAVWDWDDLSVTTCLRPAMKLGGRYDSAPTYVHRADIACVEAVRLYGGVTVAWDSVPLKPLEAFYGDSDGWCSPDGDLIPGGAFFGAVPNHPGLETILDAIENRIVRFGWSLPVNETTGPFAWMDAFGVRVIGEPATSWPLEILGRREDFYPVHSNDRYQNSLTYEQMIDRANDADAVAVHMYARSWCNGGLDVTVR
jgi:hypothetical protein